MSRYVSSAWRAPADGTVRKVAYVPATFFTPWVHQSRNARLRQGQGFLCVRTYTVPFLDCGAEIAGWDPDRTRSREPDDRFFRIRRDLERRLEQVLLLVRRGEVPVFCLLHEVLACTWFWGHGSKVVYGGF